METGKGSLTDWKEQTTADEIFRVRDGSAESQAGRLLDFTPDGINRRVTTQEAPHLKTMRDVADYLGDKWGWLNQTRVHHEVYGMCEGKRQVARDDFGTILSADLREKREEKHVGLLDRLLGRDKE